MVAQRHDPLVGMNRTGLSERQCRGFKQHSDECGANRNATCLVCAIGPGAVHRLIA